MSLVATEERGPATWLWLDRPERHNALIPELVHDLRNAIALAARSEAPLLVLSGRGESFSTGGDLDGFLDHSASNEKLLLYAEDLVATLHGAILDLLSFPAPVLAAVNGPVTGGSTGLMLAADLVAMAQHAFLQPYYSSVGFGPDGGWTAILPERIGTSKALELQYRNKRLSAQEALGLGLVASICPLEELQAQIGVWTDELGKGYPQSYWAARQNVWDECRLATVRRRLDQEKTRFLDLMGRTETLKGIRDFNGHLAGNTVGRD